MSGRLLGKGLSLLAVVTGLELGVAACSVEALYEQLVDEVAAELSPQSGISADSLVAVGSPRGEGVIVFVQNTVDAQTSTPLAWVFLSGHMYALDSASRAATPRVPLVSEAPDDAITKSGLRRENLADSIAEIIRASIQ